MNKVFDTVVRILQIYSWVNGSWILTHDPYDPSRSVDPFDPLSALVFVRPSLVGSASKLIIIGSRGFYHRV